MTQSHDYSSGATGYSFTRWAKGIAWLLVVILLAFFASLTQAKPAEAETYGRFYLYDGSNATGPARSYNMSQGYQILSSVYFNQQCGGQCFAMDNRVSSVRFECSSVDEDDYLKIWKDYVSSDPDWTIIPVNLSECVGGYITKNFPLGYNNTVSSIDAIE